MVQGYEIARDWAKNGGKQVQQRQCGVWWISICWCYRFQAGEVWVAPRQGVVMDEKMGRFDCVVDQADMVGRQTYEE